MNIPRSIVQVRKAAGMKQVELAKKTGISQTYLSQIENGKKDATIQTLETVCKALNVTLSSMLFLAMDETDIRKDKRHLFRKAKPLMDSMLKEMF